MMESNYMEKAKGDYKVSLLADLDEGVFNSISFGMLEIDGHPVCGVELTPFGLKCGYEGTGKTEVAKLVKKLETALAEEYGLTFMEEPAEEEMPQGIEEQAEQTNEETQESQESE